MRERLNAEYARMDEEEMRDLGPLMVSRGYLVHIAKLLNDAGGVSPLCAGDDPHPIDTSRRESFVYSPNNYQYVTCTSCMAAKATPPTPRAEEEG